MCLQKLCSNSSNEITSSELDDHKEYVQNLVLCIQFSVCHKLKCIALQGALFCCDCREQHLIFCVRYADSCSLNSSVVCGFSSVSMPLTDGSNWTRGESAPCCVHFCLWNFVSESYLILFLRQNYWFPGILVVGTRILALETVCFGNQILLELLLVHAKIF